MEAATASQTTRHEPVGGGVWAAVSVALALAAGLGLRLWMLDNFFEVNGDSLIYGELGKNLLLHGQYAQGMPGGELHSTLIRLPGYPFFLAACFQVFGMENYASAAWVQIALDMAGCLLLADFSRMMAPPRLREGAAHGTLWLAALCPFTAIFAVEPLTETPTLFCLAVALWSLARFRERRGWFFALWFTFGVVGAALLRPDGALAAVALAPAMVMGLGGGRERAEKRPPAANEVEEAQKTAGETPERLPQGLKPGIDLMPVSARLKSCPVTESLAHPVFPQPAKREPAARIANAKLARMAVVCVLLAVAPFAAWTWRNWQVFHVIEPLAPRTAADPGEDTYPGWERWVRTWCLDFVCTYEVYWNVPLGPLEMDKVPARAFDSAAQYAATAALAAEYNENGYVLTRALDAGFGRLAEARIAADPLRYYLWLPAGRMADMWLRPRVENLPVDLDWWAYARHNDETRFSWAYAGLNALYLVLAVAGWCVRPRFGGAMLAYLALRSALLLTITAPEARYTIECFPMLLALGGIGVWWGLSKIGALGKRVFWIRQRT